MQRTQTKLRAARKKVGDPSKSLWHRLQRSRPLTHFTKPLELSEPDTIILATLPVGGPDGWHDTHVRLDWVKQGSFRGTPATLITFEIVHSEWSTIQQSCCEVWFESYPKPSKQVTKREPGDRCAIAAYGPAYITAPAFANEPNTQPAEQLERVEMFPTARGIMVNIVENALHPTGVPPFVSCAFVVLHLAPVKLTVVLSGGDKARARRCRRSIVCPLIIDGETDRGMPLRTCGWSSHCVLGDECGEFGPEHMREAIWARLVKPNFVVPFGEEPKVSH